MWSADISSILNASNNIPGSQDKHQVNFFSNQTASKPSRQHSFPLSRTNQNFTAKQHTTPSIAKLCKQLDDDLAKLLNDIEFSTSSNLSQDQQIDPNNQEFNIANILNVDLKNFNEYLQESLLLFGNNICTSLINLIEKLKTENSSKTDSDRKSSLSDSIDLSLNIKQILLICRLSHAIPFNCPSLRLCFINLNQQLAQQQRQQQSNMKMSSQEAQNNSPIASFRKAVPQIDQKVGFNGNIY